MACLEAGRTVLTPSAELAAAINGAVERHHQVAGHLVWDTPRILDFNSWLRELNTRRQLRNASGPRYLSDLEERELWRSVVVDSVQAVGFLDPSGAARAARRARRSLYEYGIPATALADHEGEESQALRQWIARFDERCRDLGCQSADTWLANLSAATGSRVLQSLAWIESPMWRPVVRRWLGANAGHALAPVSQVAAGGLSLHATSPEAELASMADWAREQLLRRPNFRAWICVPDIARRRMSVTDALDAALIPQRYSLGSQEEGAPYAVAGGTPLAEYPPVRAALLSLMASIGVISFEDFSALLRSPELQGSATDASAAAALDVELRRHAPSEATLRAWLNLSEKMKTTESQIPAALGRLNAMLEVLSATRGAQKLSVWVAVWTRALELGPWSLRQRWSSGEYQSAERFRELLVNLAASDHMFGALARDSAQRILGRAARETIFQAHTGIPPIWVSAQVVDPWLPYDGIWVTGCSAKDWPAPVEPIPLLPVAVQVKYGVISADPKAQMAFATDMQKRWQARTTQAVFSYADPGDGSHSLQSALIPLESMSLAPPQPQPHWHFARRFAPELETFADDQAPPFDDSERTRGVWTLRSQSRCAFRGFAEIRLDAGELQSPTPGFSDRERGQMLHAALEKLWARESKSAVLLNLSPDIEAQWIAECASAALAAQCLKRDPGARWRLWELPRMQSVLAHWLDRERGREPFAVESLEHGGELTIPQGPTLKVRIDRIDRLADGARILIDYKSGMAMRDWQGERPDNPQLPVYAMLRPEGLVAVAYAQVNAAECKFVIESERAELFKPRGRKTSLEGMESLSALRDIWIRRITHIGQEFSAGYAAVAPTPLACRSCNLQGLCRIPSGLDNEDE